MAKAPRYFITSDPDLPDETKSWSKPADIFVPEAVDGLPDGDTMTRRWPGSYAGIPCEMSVDGVSWTQVPNCAANDGWYWTTVAAQPGLRFRLKP